MSLFKQGQWAPYTGPQGGTGWISDNGEVDYSDEPPGPLDLSQFSDDEINQLREAFEQDGRDLDQYITDDSSDGINIENAVSEQSLSDKLGKKTFGVAKHMDVLEMEDGSEVYKVTVDNDMMEEARDKTMTGYNFLNQIGASTAKYDVAEDGSWFASEDAGGESLRSVSDEVRDKIDPDDVEQVMAEQLLVGNWDAHPENIRVNDEGEITVYDYDNACNDMTDMQNISAFWETFSYIEDMVDGSLNRDAIEDKAAEIATQVSLDMVDEIEDSKGTNPEMFEKINNNLSAALEGDL